MNATASLFAVLVVTGLCVVAVAFILVLAVVIDVAARRIFGRNKD